jgi:tRNA threonylcarbamoyladenosine biosynthesis protein TsaE
MHTNIISTDDQATERLAEQVGHKLRGGEVIELVSDLGGGKTTFVRGLARGMGSHDHVKSPSFTLANEYTANDLTLYHYDFYRLNDPGIIAHELADTITNPKAVVVIEWAAVVHNVLPGPHMVITLKPIDEHTRNVLIDYPKEYTYLMPTLKLTS